MKILFLALAVGSSLAAASQDSWASEAKSLEALPAALAAPANEVSDNFRQLKYLFDTGSMPSIPQVTTGYAGRCFGSDSAPAKGAAYVIVPSASENGPIDPNPSLSVTSVWHSEATHYDHASIESILTNGVFSGSLDSSSGSLLTVMPGTTGSFLRENGQYLIEKIAQLDGSGLSYYCYYFITLQ